MYFNEHLLFASLTPLSSEPRAEPVLITFFGRLKYSSFGQSKGAPISQIFSTLFLNGVKVSGIPNTPPSNGNVSGSYMVDPQTVSKLNLDLVFIAFASDDRIALSTVSSSEHTSS